MSKGEHRTSGALDPDFDAATPRASLQILTIIGAALRPRLAALADTDDDTTGTDWIEILNTLAGVLAGHLPQVEDVDELENVWNQFFATGFISKLPALPKRILNEVRAASAGSSTIDECVAVFGSFNQEGHAIATRLIAQRKLGGLPSRQPAALSIFWDPRAAHYCAATTRTDRRVRWAHQPVRHGLYAALIPDLVFAHEYFSHLSPKNPRLSRTLTEVWLVVALTMGIAEGSQQDRHWQKVVWALLRASLSGATPSLSAADELRKHGLYGVEELAVMLYAHSPETFWKLTRIVVSFPADHQPVELDDLLVKLVRAGGMWQTLADRKWSNMNDLRNIIN